VSDQEQIYIHYSGKVQGVGFRQTTKTWAKELGLTGWVKNLKDGRVEIIAEGDSSKLDQLQRMLKEQFEGYIVKTDVRRQKAQGKFQDFTIV